jgi:chemotaxis protein methyltransferase CheR
MQVDAVPDALWQRVSEFIGTNTGLHFPAERRADLQRGLTAAAMDFGLADGTSCAEWLLSAPMTRVQLQTLATHLTIGETYFFRERKAFDALAERILPELLRSRRGRGQRLRLWSAACSTGEEPYSLAILLRQMLPDWQDWDVTILATDINERFLQKAVAGVYGEWSFRESPPGFKERYFTPTSDGRFAISPQIKDCVSFTHMNLAQDRFPSLTTDTHAMDIIFCRNVLIYFTASHARKLVANLRRALVDEGWLAVSPSEYSQALFSRFVAVNFPGSVLYRKCAVDDNSSSTWAPPLSDAVSECAVPVFHVPQPSAPPTPAQPIPDLQALSLTTRELANQGRHADALAWSERWLAADKIDSAAHYMHAMILQETGKPEAARSSLQRAIYLQPDFVLAHFALGNLARADARSAEAHRYFANALRLLRCRPPDALLPESDGMTAGRLVEIITTLLAQPDRPLATPKASPHDHS